MLGALARLFRRSPAPVPEESAPEADDTPIGTRRQGACCRCRQEKEVILLAKESGGVKINGKHQQLYAAQQWACAECFAAAVDSRPRIHYI